MCDQILPRRASPKTEGLELPGGAVFLEINVAMFIAYLLKEGRVIYVGTVQLGQSIIYLKENVK